MNEQPTPAEFREILERAKDRRLVIETSPEDLTREAEAMAEQIKARAEEAAKTAVRERVTVSISPRGRVRRNGPCPCGSGRKFKKCCLREVRDPESEKKLPPPRVLRHYLEKKRQ